MMIALVGFNANAAMYIVGNAPLGQGWDPNKGVEMTDNGDGTYTFVTSISGSVWFVFADGLDSNWNTFNGTYRYGPTNHADQEVAAEAWTTTQKQGNGEGSYKFTGTGEEYTIIFDKTNLQFIIKGYVAPITYDSFTVAGSSEALFGTTWDPTNTANDMTLMNGLYTFNKSNVELTPGNLEFKVVADHDANYGAAWPANNFIQAVEKHGLYDVEITFNEDTKDIECNLDLLQEIVDPVIDDYYIVAGTENLFGSNWANTDTLNLMTEGENGVFTWTKVGFEATAGTKVEFKVIANGNWNTCWPASDEEGDHNWEYTFTQDGVYTVVITFNEETKEINLTAERTGDLPEPPQPTVDNVYIMGNVNGLTWDAINGVQMTYDETTKVYTAEINVTDANNGKGYFGFTKQLADTTLETNVWEQIAPYRFGPLCDPEAENWVITENLLGTDCALDMQSSKSIEIPAGTWTVTVDLNTNVFKINGEWPTDTVVPEPYTGEVYILGNVNDNGGWFTNKGVKMTRDAENNVYTATITTTGEAYVDPVTNIGYSYFSFTKQLADSAADWEAIAPYRFGAVSEGDFLVTEEQLNKELSLEMNVEPHAFKITAGQWNLTLSVDNMTLVITKAAGKRGDVNGDGNVDITDATTLINFLLYGDATGIVQENANCDLQNNIDISDATTLINYLLYGSWGE